MIRTTNMAEAVARFEEIKQAVKARNEANRRSAWARGVGEYALELLDGAEWVANNGYIFQTWQALNSALLNGADDWMQYSEGGCALIYDGDIAQRLCTPSELKRTDGGRRNPNGRENWIECQARALHQASNRILKAFNGLKQTANA